MTSRTTAYPKIFFALEVMKHCAFGGTRFNYDAIEATALESVFVKFVESGIEDSLSRVFGRSVGGYSHCAYHTDQSVCRQVQFFLFSIFALFAQIVTRACRNVTLPKPDRVVALVPGASCDYIRSTRSFGMATTCATVISKQASLPRLHALSRHS